MAMVWIALLSGGDYTPEGLYSIGESLGLDLIICLLNSLECRT